MRADGCPSVGGRLISIAIATKCSLSLRSGRGSGKTCHAISYAREEVPCDRLSVGDLRLAAARKSA